MAVSDITTGQYVQISQSPASIGERMGAQLIDWVVQGLYVYIMMVILAEIPGIFTIHYSLFTMLLVLLPTLFYGPLCELFNQGQTIGKYMLKLRVVKKDGSMPSLGSSLLRWVLFLVDGPMLSFVGVLVMLLTTHRQRIGDLAAGTLVIKLGSYSKIQVSLDEFSHLGRNYHPTYPQAADLSLEQVNLISKTIQMDNTDPRVHALSQKVQQVLGIEHVKESTDHAFLRRLEKDYQYYALEEV